jgi:nucleotide-binding universal stress UspA family protein
MAFEDILVSLTTYPKPTSNAAIQDAVELAAVLGSRISAIACEVKVPAPASPMGSMLLNVPALVKNEMKKSADNAKAALEAFCKLAEDRGVFQDELYERCLTSEVPGVIIDYARLRDLTIVPIPDSDYTERWLAESVIFGAGRPIIVLPDRSRWRRPVALDRIVVAWDFSRNASRALADALPILKQAEHAYVTTVTNEKTFDTRRSGSEVGKYLARHGVEVTIDAVDADGRDIGSTLEAHVTLRDADLLVMGAYGHSRFREFVLGGATRSILGRPPIPTFLSH